MRNALFVLSLTVFGLISGLGGYYAAGRSDAIDDARPLARLAERLTAHGEAGAGLGPGRVPMLLAVEGSPAGIDLDTSGDGLTTLTQALAKRLAFERFEPGIAEIRQAGYTSGLERQLSKRHILALWLETVEMGRGPRGRIRGFYNASWRVYDRPPSQLTNDEFLRLLVVATAPSRFHLNRSDPALEARVAQIRKLLAQRCGATGHGDLAHDGCERT